MRTGNRAGRPAHGQRAALVAHRLKIAAAQAGYETTVAMAAALGVEDSTISRYWRGTHVPSPENLELYAQAVGKPIDWFWADSDDAYAQRIARAALNIAELVMAGFDLAESAGREAGQVDLYSVQERRRLRAATPVLREHLTAAVGGDWGSAAPEERQRALERVAAAALVTEGDEPASPAPPVSEPRARRRR
jgi:transcriptional regulator with XRE-family HTH domain